MDEKVIMAQWDKWRHYIANGGVASWPRDEFENLIDCHREEISILESQLKEKDERIKELEGRIEKIIMSPYINSLVIKERLNKLIEKK
jgi:hypothetical protein